MNQGIETLLSRKSVRAYEKRVVEPDIRAAILKATLRAPTAGNMMLYSIIDVTDQGKKDRLVTTCDNQPFIARSHGLALPGGLPALARLLHPFECGKVGKADPQP